MTLEYCADAIALYSNKLVLVNRLSIPYGLAIPGGRREYLGNSLEDVSGCAIREFKEETGLDLVVQGELGCFDAKNRDPRGPKVSNVVFGSAYGDIRNEQGKTEVMLLNPDLIDLYKKRFAFDHYEILKQWERRVGYQTNKFR